MCGKGLKTRAVLIEIIMGMRCGRWKLDAHGAHLSLLEFHGPLTILCPGSREVEVVER